MIIEVLADSAPYQFNSGLRTKIQGIVLPEIPTVDSNNVCYCKIECKYIENVFAKIAGESWENDKNSFLYSKLISADTVTIKLYKDNIEIATITDDTYGDYTNGFAAQPLYVGFVIDWEAVYTAFGAGMYQIKTETSIVGISSTLESQLFSLMQYSDEAADKTVVIKATQNGNIISSQFDFTDLNWFWQFRIKGKLTKESPEIEQDKYIASDYTVNQIQDKLIRNWTLETKLLPASISNLLIEDNILGNEFLITDYNIMNNEVYRNISLYVKTPEVNNKANNRRSQINIQFTDKKDNIIKRNF